jgi:hypothetical protein
MTLHFVKHVFMSVFWRNLALMPEKSVLEPYLTYHLELPVVLARPRLWSSGQSTWLQVQRSGFDFRRYQFF